MIEADHKVAVGGQGVVHSCVKLFITAQAVRENHRPHLFSSIVEFCSDLSVLGRRDLEASEATEGEPREPR